MRLNKYIVLVAAVIVLASCGTKKAIVTPETEVTWHTCLIQGARATITHDGDSYSASITMQTVRDSMIVITVMPMLGIEMARLEATPMELTAIDKIHGQYAELTYAELNRKLTPSLNWDVLQQISTGEMPMGTEKARMMYSFGDQTIEIVIDYAPRKLDVPVKIGKINKNRYTKVDVSRWL